MTKAYRSILLAGVFMLVGSCAVGPDFKKPAAPVAKAYTAEPMPEKTASAPVAAGASQRFVQGMDLPGQWWKLFHSEPLDRLVEQALKSNPDVQSAQASLRMAKEEVYAQKGAYYPTIVGDFTGSRQKSPTTLSPVPNENTYIFNLFTPEVNVSYAPDVFGLNRRTVESVKAQQEAQRFQLEATYLTLTTNVVLTAIQQASLRAQVDATQKIIAAESESLELFKRELALGQIAESDLAAQEALLAQAMQALPPLQKQLAQQNDALPALLGRLPDEKLTELFSLSDLQLPERLPVSLPSRLVEQRPDIRAAEANLHAASAEIGIAIANRLPNITLSAGSGATALVLSDLFKPGTGLWSIAGEIAQPVFDGGTLLHKERAAKAAYDQAQAQYRSTVIAAFQNVADTLHALQYDADAVAASARTEDAASRSLKAVETQLRLGDVNYLALLSAQQVYQQAALSLVQAQANRYADTVALFQALGGGWWNRGAGQEEGDGKEGGPV